VQISDVRENTLNSAIWLAL